ncbi:MAG: LPS biosynthesis protein WbpP [Candidatus Dadabacteria bacterium]
MRNLNISRFLVTGGAGFIGSHIVEELLKRGTRVRVLDNFETGKRENLRFPNLPNDTVDRSLELIEGDIRNLDVCREACDGMDYVLHQAALTSVPKSVNYPGVTNEVNVNGTLNVLLAAKEKGIKRVVYASSSSIYGKSDRLPLQEDQKPSPISPYAVSKLAGEYYCAVFSKIYGLETISLRYFNVFGPRQDPQSKYAAVIPKFIQAALKGEPLEIHGDGLQTRDFTYVDNVVEANLLAIKIPNTNGEVVNIACGKRYSILDLVNGISEILGKELRTYRIEQRTADVRHSLADTSLATRLLGYGVKVDFIEGLTKTIAYFNRNSD